MRDPSWLARLLPIALLFAMLALIAAVRHQSARVDRFPRCESAADADAAGPPYPLRIVTPGAAAAVTVPARPGRLLIANATLTDIVTELVEPARIVALPEQATTWSRLVDVDEGFRRKALFRTLDAERVIEFAPDLVLCSDFNTQFAGDWVDRVGIAVLSLPHPRSLEELDRSIALLGRVLDVGARADALRASIRTRQQALRAGAERRRGLTALTYSNLGAGGWSEGAGSLADAMLRLAGLDNVAAQVGARGSFKLTFEDLLVLDPDLIVVPARFGEQASATAELLRAEPSLRQLRALRRDGVVELHPRLFSTGSQEVVRAAERVAAAVDARLRRGAIGGSGR